MAINLSAVAWDFVGLMTALAFITALLGSYIAFRNRFWGAVIAAILFAIGFVAWNYYPHTFGLPVLKTTGVDGTPASTTAATAPSAAPAAPSTPPASAPASPAPGGPPENSSH
jgi:hypothetical protein